MTNWYASCSYNAEQKQRIHTAARARLRTLATELRFAPGSFDIRSNRGGIAVSGEITLHHERVYVQVSQSMIVGDTGILMRSCEGRRDFTGGPNHIAPLSLLDDIAELATMVRQVSGGQSSFFAAPFKSRHPA